MANRTSPSSWIRSSGAAGSARRDAAARPAPPRPSPTPRRHRASPSRGPTPAPGSRGWPAGRAACGPRPPKDAGGRPASSRSDGLDRLPVGHHLVHAAHRHVAEDVGVAADDLRPQRPVDIGQVEGSLLPRPTGHGGRPGGTGRRAPRRDRRVTPLDGVDRLVGLLQDVRPEAAVILAPVPGAAVRGPKPGADRSHAVGRGEIVHRTAGAGPTSPCRRAWRRPASRSASERPRAAAAW